MAKNYELFINNGRNDNYYPFFLQYTGEYFNVPDDIVDPKDLCTMMFDEVYRTDEDLCENLASGVLDYFIVRQFTPMEIAEYIMSTFFWTYDPNDHEYFISYDVRNEKLNDISYISKEWAISVTCHVDYDIPYMGDENCERFFEETENIDNKNFMKVCATLADRLNYEICDF